MKNIKTLEELKGLAISFQKPVEVFFKLTGTTERLMPPIGADKTYCLNCCVVSFVEDSTLYAIPFTKKVIEILRLNGFRAVELYVPFSGSNYYPLAQKEHWQALVAQARAIRAEE